MIKLISFLIPSILFANYYLNAFYNIGAGLLDSGWFIYLATNLSDTILQNPEALSYTHLGTTYLNTHISPIYLLFATVYKIFFLWLEEEIYVALLFGSFYGVISFAIINILIELKIKPYIALLIAILISLNGQSLAMVGFPHFEVLIPAFILLFFSLYFTKNKKLSYLVFILLLSVREDAGFHFFGLVSIFVIIEYLESKSLNISKKFIKFALLAFSYSIITILIQKSFFATDNAFVRIYAGDPAFSHLTLEFIANRLEFLLQNREYLYAPSLGIIILSIVYKNYYLLIALISVIPWTLLSLSAITPMPGTLSNYYAFVFILVLAWSPFAFYIKSQKTNLLYKKELVSTTLIITLLSIFLFPNNGGNVDAKPWRHFDFKYKNMLTPTHQFKNFMIENKAFFGTILFDEAMSLFFIHTMKKDEYGYLNNFNEKQLEAVTTVVYKKNSSQNIMNKIIKMKQLNHIYEVKGTDIMIATKREILNDKYDFMWQ